MPGAERVSGRGSPPVRLYRESPWRRLFRRLVHVVLPSCTCPAVLPLPKAEPAAFTVATGSVLTGTFYGRRTNRVSFCLQEHPKARPSLLLELPVLTSYLAFEMQDGIVRLVLECDHRTFSGCPLWSVPVWTAFCNGRKIGFTESKKVAEEDDIVLKSMEPVSAGAGMLPGKKDSQDDPFLYLRANFSRVVGSADSESFHLINPAGCTDQELSIFMIRQ